MKHISVRVPWHDNGWNSHVCANPRCNTFCKQLPNIVNSKVDCEQLSCGIDWSKLTTKERPACAGENGGFMNYKAYEREFIHIYAWYLQPIITQYFIDNKSEIWLLFLIAHSKR